VPETYSLLLIGVFAVLALLRLAESWFIVRYVRRVRTEPLGDADCPPALVVLCLRGGDPFLHRTLEALIAQDYPRYQIRIVVDSPQDDAHRYLAEALGPTPPAHVEVRTLVERYRTCTFKMSGILHGTHDVPEEVALVALMDGDTVPHASWLRELATPIVRGDAAVTTGNRWFFPETPTLGSMCRFWWNAAAVPQMTLFHMPWGGTMAVRRDLIIDERLRERIQHACSEDTSVGQFARDQGERVHFEPSLIIVNREEIGVGSFFDFETRQLLFTRLEFRPYRWMVLIGLLTLVMVAYPLARVAGLDASPWADAAFAAYFLINWAGVFLLGMSVRSVLARRGETLAGWGGRRWLFATLGAFAMPILHLAAVVRAALMKRVRWRGVRYRLGGGTRIEVAEDEWARHASGH